MPMPGISSVGKVLTVGTLAVLAQLVAVAPVDAENPEPAAPLRIMPLGDSITEGWDPESRGAHGGYRADLWQAFQADGRTVDFVGSADALTPPPPPRLGDGNHEGHGGWRIDQIANGRSSSCTADGPTWGDWIRNVLDTHEPEVVLLHIGTNDIIQGANGGPNVGCENATGMRDRLSRLLDVMTAFRPAMRIHVATLIPINDARDQHVSAFNALLPALVQAKADQNRKVALVKDMNTAVEKSWTDLPDGVHPSNGAYSRMAARWYAALNPGRLSRVEAEAPGNVLGGQAAPLPSSHASDGVKIGHLDDTGHVDLTVTVGRSRTFRLYVRTATGAAGSCSLRLTANGAAPRTLPYQNHGWDQWVITATDVWLNAGENTVQIRPIGCATEIDSVDVVARGTGDASGITPGQAYTLTSVPSGKCLDAGRGDQWDAPNVQQWQCTDAPRQDWRPTATADGRFTLTNVRSGLCLEVPGGSTTPGTAVQQTTCNGSEQQKWQPVNIGPGVYNLVTGHSAQCLDVDAGSPLDGAKVQQWTCNGAPPQAWRLTLS